MTESHQFGDVDETIREAWTLLSVTGAPCRAGWGGLGLRWWGRGRGHPSEAGTSDRCPGTLRRQAWLVKGEGTINGRTNNVRQAK